MRNFLPQSFTFHSIICKKATCLLHFTSYFILILSYCPHVEHKLNNSTKSVSGLTLAFVPKVGTFGPSSLLADCDSPQSKEPTC